jgi:hypothetical protein
MDRFEKQGDYLRGKLTQSHYLIERNNLRSDKFSLHRIRLGNNYLETLQHFQFKKDVYRLINRIEEEYSRSEKYLNSIYSSGLITRKEYEERLKVDI